MHNNEQRRRQVPGQPRNELLEAFDATGRGADNDCALIAHID
jgi:hypothetical protein